MKKLLILFILSYLLSLLIIVDAEARRGCCSHHGGVCGCVCCDGTALSAKCAPYYPDCSDAKKDKSESQQPLPTRQTENKNYFLCIRVIDGDTIVLAGNEKVRLIGVDTPETVHPSKPVEYFGKEASAFTKRMVEGKQVRLEYDWQKKDK